MHLMQFSLYEAEDEFRLLNLVVGAQQRTFFPHRMLMLHKVEEFFIIFIRKHFPPQLKLL